LAIEFANNGFDLVTLDLDMCVEQLPLQGNVPEEAVAIAIQTIAQLREIGDELQFASDWQNLLQSAEAFANDATQDTQAWQRQWGEKLRSLKECARNVGKLPQPKPTQKATAAPASPTPVAKPLVNLTPASQREPGKFLRHPTSTPTCRQSGNQISCRGANSGTPGTARSLLAIPGRNLDGYTGNPGVLSASPCSTGATGSAGAG
jgi:hypothetical protein